MKIAFFDTKKYDRDSFDKIKGNYPGVTIKYYKYHLYEDTVILANGFDAVCVFVNDAVNEVVLKRLYEYGIKLILLRCAGFNNVNVKYAKKLGIKVYRVPAYSPYAVAEYAFALINTLNRKTYRAYIRTRDNNFNIAGLIGMDLKDKTIGIIGMGKIGLVVKDIALGYGMNVLAYDKFPREIEKVKFVELEEIYKTSDIITLHCPLMADNYHMINKNSISMMKKGVMIINTSRGGLVDTDDLIAGIKNKKIGAVGLDVYEDEADYFFNDHSDDIVRDDSLARLISFNNVILSSHQAFLTSEALENIAKTTLDNIDLYLNDTETINEIK